MFEQFSMPWYFHHIFRLVFVFAYYKDHYDFRSRIQFLIAVILVSGSWVFFSGLLLLCPASFLSVSSSQNLFYCFFVSSWQGLIWSRILSVMVDCVRWTPLIFLRFESQHDLMIMWFVLRISQLVGFRRPSLYLISTFRYLSCCMEQ